MAVLTGEHDAQVTAAARRIEERTEQRRRNVTLLREPGGIAAVNSPEQVVQRLDRLSRYYVGERLPSRPGELPTAPLDQVATAALERVAAARLPGLDAAAGAAPVEAAGIVLEAIVGTRDFLDVSFLDAGVAAARAVGRVHVPLPDGRTRFGTGSLVTRRLMLTNHHVLPDAGAAASAQIEFNYQLGLDGQPLHPRLFALDPGAFFFADDERDFALVAVRAATGELAEFGVNRLVQAGGKAAVGDFVTIVQHPQARRKEVALRESKVVDELETVLHYAADTEGGSSGSPVFNDEWDIVALHHAAVRVADHDELGGIVNEGIRISRIVEQLRATHFPPAQQKLLDELGTWERIAVTTSSTVESGPSPAAPGRAPAPAAPPSAPSQGTELTIPLELTVSIRSPLLDGGGGGGAADGNGRAPMPAAVEPAPVAAAPADDSIEAEAIEIDPDYADREGYDPSFLGRGGQKVPLPVLSPRLLADAAKLTDPPAGADPHVLPYHRFSIVMNRVRRLAFFTAVNIDGGKTKDLGERKNDKWAFDPRIPRTEQTGEDMAAKDPAGKGIYFKSTLDRGHLVRRLDAAWGSTLADAKRSSDDTFHFTNCTPQHKDFNERAAYWAGLENYVLKNADGHDLKVSVFSGPIFAEDDDSYRGVLLPRQFWKVVAMAKPRGKLSAAAYLLSQEQLIAGKIDEALEEFSYGAYKTFQVPIAKVEKLTGLSFGALGGVDTFVPPKVVDESTGALPDAREVTSASELLL